MSRIRKGPAISYETKVEVYTTVRDAADGRLITSFTTTGKNDKHDSVDGAALAVAPALAEALAAHNRITSALDGAPGDA